MNYRRLALILAIVAIAGVVGYFGYRFIVDSDHVDTNPMDGIPENYTYFIKFKDFSAFERNVLLDSNLLTSQITPFYGDSSLNVLKQIFSSASFKEWANENLAQSFIVSSHFQGISSFSTLFTFSKNKDFTYKNIEEMAGQGSVVEQVKFGDMKMGKLTIKGFSKPIFIADENGLLGVSTDQLLVERVIKHSRKKDFITNQELLKKAQKVEGEGTDMVIYLNINYLHRQISAYSNGFAEEVKWLTKFGNTGVFDLKLKGSKMLASGFLLDYDTVKTIASDWNGQAAKSLKSYSLIPQNAVFVACQSFSDFEALRHNTKNNNGESGFSLPMVDIDAEVVPWVNDEAGIFILDGKMDEIKQNAFGYFSVKDKLEAIQSLETIKAKNMNAIIAVDTITYRGFELKNLGVDNFMPAIFGSDFKTAGGKYYTFIDDFLVFGGSRESLGKLVDSYLLGRVMIKSKSFNSILSDLGKQSHLFYFINPSRFSFFESLISQDVYRKIEQMNFPMNNLNGIGLQFTFEDGGVYMNMVAEEGNSSSTTIDDSWESALDAQLILSPRVVLNTTTNEVNILAFDIENNLYLIGAMGDIKWKLPLMERPMSEIMVVDFNRDGQNQFVFNTRNYIYIVDANGNRVGKSPMKLPASADGGLSVLDYDKTLNYRVVIPLSDKKIYNFNLNLEGSLGWMMPKSNSAIITPIPYFRIQDKDILLIADTLGNVKFSNRKGEERFVASNAFTNNPRTGFFVNGNYLYTTDKIGRVVKLDNNGKVEKIELEQFSRNHGFVVTDYNMDGAVDFAFIDENKIFIYNESKEVLFEKEFDFNLSDLTSIISTNSDSTKLFFKNTSDNSLLVLTPDGNISERKDIIANDRFYVYKATKSNQIRLITVNNRILGNFLIY